ncbi:MAG: lamin tail domain-containing protein [Planctomycetes bacterium]|nr:lamin tail domain-containing protein [Planctomycetota bacterium]
MRSFVVAALLVSLLAFSAMMATACGDYANTTRGDVFVPAPTGPNPNNLPNANGVPKPGLPGGHAVASSSVGLSEVLTGSGGFIELVNNGGDDVDIGGWVLSDGTSTFTFPGGFRLYGGARVAVNLGNSGTPHNGALYAPSFGDLGDVGGLALQNYSGVVDFVQWGAGGQAYEAAAVGAGLWNAGDSLLVPAEGFSLNQDASGWFAASASPGN